MNLMSIVGIALSGVFLIVAAVFFLLSRRHSSSGRPLDSNHDRVVVDDRGDRVIWEMGQSWPLVNKEAEAKMLTRRAFVPRAVLGISAFFVGWGLTRGSTDAQSLQKMGGTGAQGAGMTLDGAEARRSAAPFQQDHNDSHNDFETHGDNMISHQDETNARGIHFDVPHNDLDTGHFDIHSDS